MDDVKQLGEMLRHYADSEAHKKQQHEAQAAVWAAQIEALYGQIEQWLAPILAGESDMVTGYKQGKYEKAFVSNIYNALCRWLFGVRVTDLNSVKAYRREIMEGLPVRPDWHRYMVVIAAAQGFTDPRPTGRVDRLHQGDRQRHALQADAGARTRVLLAGGYLVPVCRPSRHSDPRRLLPSHRLIVSRPLSGCWHYQKYLKVRHPWGFVPV